jgi:hypothetical protein
MPRAKKSRHSLTVILAPFPQAKKKDEPEPEAEKALPPVEHGESFGICLVDESEPTEDTSGVAPGLRYEHEAPAATPSDVSTLQRGHQTLHQASSLHPSSAPPCFLRFPIRRTPGSFRVMTASALRSCSDRWQDCKHHSGSSNTKTSRAQQ